MEASTGVGNGLISPLLTAISSYFPATEPATSQEHAQIKLDTPLLPSTDHLLSQHSSHVSLDGLVMLMEVAAPMEERAFRAGEFQVRRLRVVLILTLGVRTLDP